MFICILLGLCIVGLRVGQLQLLEGGNWETRMAKAQSRKSTGNETRGSISDRNGNFLAVDVPFFIVGIDPLGLSKNCASDFEVNPLLVKKESQRAVSSDEFSKEIAIDEFLDMLLDCGLQLDNSLEETLHSLEASLKHNCKWSRDAGIETKSETNKSPIQYLRLGILRSVAEKNRFEALERALKKDFLKRNVFPRFVTRFERLYPYEDSLQLLLGEMRGKTNDGNTGLENDNNEVLKRQKTLSKQRSDSRGRPLEDPTTLIPGYSGQDLILSIDILLQKEIEHLCLQNMRRTSAKSVSALVLDPFTGEIFSWVTVPALARGERTRIRNTFKEAEADRRIREKSSRLERLPKAPGSVVKPLIMAKALSMGLPLTLALDVKSKDQFIANDNSRRGRGRIFRDSSLLRDKTLAGAVIYSSNIGMADLGLHHMSKKQLSEGLEMFGLGQRTGIELFGEDLGLLKPVEDWDWYTRGSACFGYEMRVTPIQVARAYMAIANGGYLLNPTFMKDKEVNSVPFLNEEVARKTRTVLRRVVTEGTGRHVIQHVGPELVDIIRSGRLEMAGKTGTIKLLNENKEFSTELYSSSFVGFAPVENAQFLTVVMVEEPTTEDRMYYASKSAAPLGAQILASAMNLSGFDPYQVRVEKKEESEAGNLEVSHEAGNVVLRETSTGRVVVEEQEGEPEQW
ncbi:penicillin-binding protein 2 [Planctomycetota bacterium]|nr:penicillin-binding protein 2 [Planctomycetota bacterium]